MVAPKARPKPAPKVAFASLVRKHMAIACPDYRFIETTGGSGPLVSFNRPTKKYPKLREQIVFQKGLHGATWFRVNLFPTFVGAGAGAMQLEHTLWEGEKTGPDVRYETAAALDTAVQAAASKLEVKAAKFFATFEKAYPRLDKLYGKLVEHYAAWLARTGKQLAPEAFIDGDDGKLPAFDSFKRYLKAQKLLAGQPGDTETPLWRFWHGGRPMRETDYRKGDYYDCTKCGAFTSFARGKLVKTKDSIVGTHYAFVCKKH